MKYFIIFFLGLLVSCAEVEEFIESGDITEPVRQHSYVCAVQVDTLEEAFLFTSSLRYVSDPDAHGVRDYWQAPNETIARGTGDCEDFAILFSYLASTLGYKAEIQLGDGHAISLINGLQYDPSPILTQYGYKSASLAIDTTSYNVDAVYDVIKAINMACDRYDTF